MVMWGWWSGPSVVFACSCAGDVSISEQFTNATTVFVGTAGVVSEHDWGKEVMFTNVRAWKGVAEDGVVVGTGKGLSDCGFNFAVGEEYIVFGYGTYEMQTNVCSGTRLATDVQMQNIDRIAGLSGFSDAAQKDKERDFFVALFVAIIGFTTGVLATKMVARKKS